MKAHSIHVWYIYLHLIDFYGKCWYQYNIPYMAAMGRKNVEKKPWKSTPTMYAILYLPWIYPTARMQSRREK